MKPLIRELAVVSALLCLANASAAQVGGGAIALPVTPQALRSGTILVAFETGPGKLRAYTQTGVMIFAVDHPAWTNSGSGRQVVVDGDHHIWVSDPGTQSLYQFGPDGRFLHSFPMQFPCGQSGGVGIRGFTFGPEGSIFVVGGWNSGAVNSLVEVEPETGTTLACYSLGFEPSDIACGSDGYLYVTAYYGNIHKIDPANGSTVAIIDVSACQATPNIGEIRAMRGGRLLVADANGAVPGLSQLLVVDPNAAQACAGTVSFAASGGPWGIDAWGGNFYAGGQDGHIYIIDAVSMQVTTSFPTGQLTAIAATIDVVP